MFLRIDLEALSEFFGNVGYVARCKSDATTPYKTDYKAKVPELELNVLFLRKGFASVPESQGLAAFKDVNIAATKIFFDNLLRSTMWATAPHA